MIVYRAICKATGKIYVGKYERPWLQGRWSEHIKDANKGSSRYFHRAIRKYGSDNFTLDILGTADSREELIFLEILFIAALKANDPAFGYNMTEGGDGFRGHHSSKTKNKISELQKGKGCGSLNPFFGKKHSDQTRAIMRQRKIGHTPWNKGITLSEDQKINMYGQRWDEERRKNWSLRCKGRIPWNKSKKVVAK